MKLRIGTRGSALALAQCDIVITALIAAHPGLEVERRIVRTEGDRRRRASLLAIGGRGVFTRELEIALLDGEIDVAVHSLKDLPTTLPDGLVLAAVPRRADPRDVLIGHGTVTLESLPAGALIGSGSLRRRAQLLVIRPDLVMHDIRGNVDTRLRKLDRGDYDAIVLAAAGLARLGLLSTVPATPLDEQVMLSAPAQGALGLECRADDEPTRFLLSRLDHAPTHAEVRAERALLRRFGAGCRLPLAALARSEGDTLTLRARVVREDGRALTEARGSGTLRAAAELGVSVAERLVVQGALDFLPRESAE